jgi:SAM-dependent methyltransferase
MLKRALKKVLGEEVGKDLHRLRRSLAYYKESLLGGGGLREYVLIKLLEQHYSSKFRRQWKLSDEEPHFYSHRIGFFDFAFGNHSMGPYAYYRAFFSSEVLREGDRLLDIGCGDGFFTKRFLSEKCHHIDAIDIEPTAIGEALSLNNAPNITYYVLDAVTQPFPSESYEVIVWDGAMGHFSADTTDHILKKICNHLTPEGIFVGSESLGTEGSDHLQFFYSLGDLYSLFKRYFKHVEMRSMKYKLGRNVGLVREEAYWRCSNGSERLESSHWKIFSKEPNAT